MPLIKVHHLNNSRSQRVLWLLEEIGLDYEVIRYQRDAKTMLAPASLRRIHPLGKSPIIEDGSLRLAETGAIVDYLVDRYGKRIGAGAGRRSLLALSLLAALRRRLADASPLGEASRKPAWPVRLAGAPVCRRPDQTASRLSGDGARQQAMVRWERVLRCGRHDELPARSRDLAQGD